MRATPWLIGLALGPALFVAGCADPVAPRQRTEDEVRENLSRLSPEDQRLAEKQKYCAVRTDHELGSMGTPIKVMVKDQPVFLCCAGCKKKALADPDKTLAQVKQLRAAAARPPEKQPDGKAPAKGK